MALEELHFFWHNTPKDKDGKVQWQAAGGTAMFFRACFALVLCLSLKAARPESLKMWDFVSLRGWGCSLTTALSLTKSFELS